SLFDNSALEFAIPSYILGGLAWLNTGWMAALELPGNVFATVMMFLGVLALGGFGLTIAIFGMLKFMGQKGSGFWYLLSSLALSGISVFIGLMMFIAALTR